MTIDAGRLGVAADRAGGPSGPEPATQSQPKALIADALFNYTDEQHQNIQLGHHPDCCADEVCAYCGASEANGQACFGNLTGLALELFEEAACSARNANVKSIGQFTNWKVNDRHARAFDAAARTIAAIAGVTRRGRDGEAGSVGEADSTRAEGIAQPEVQP